MTRFPDPFEDAPRGFFAKFLGLGLLAFAVQVAIVAAAIYLVVKALS